MPPRHRSSVGGFQGWRRTRPTRGPRSNDLCTVSEHASVRSAGPSDGSFGSQSPNMVLGGFGLVVHERRTSRRPWAFIVEGASVACRDAHNQWGRLSGPTVAGRGRVSSANAALPDSSWTSVGKSPRTAEPVCQHLAGCPVTHRTVLRHPWPTWKIDQPDTQRQGCGRSRTERALYLLCLPTAPWSRRTERSRTTLREHLC